MPSALHMLKKVEINTPVKGVTAVALDAAVGLGASAAIGYTHHVYGDKWAGKHVARIAAVVGKAGALFLSYSKGGHQNFVGSTLNSVGQAGINAMGLEWGLKKGAAKTGKKAVLISSAAALPPGASEMVALGELGRAPAGRGMSWEQIEELARSH